jgi:D-3-phosphoglycerate dehydrogenase
LSFRVVYTDFGFENVDTERALITAAGGQLVESSCTTVADVIDACKDADAVLVQWAPMPKEVIESLSKCRLIVRVGIGVDNVDLDAAAQKGITVCNVPDYCIDEVADHTMALALALGRDLTRVDTRVRQGTWKITPVGHVGSFGEQTFVTVGFGRIARAVHHRASGFGFRLAAYDPFVSATAMENAGVERLELDDLFAQADILSLHAALSAETQHLISRQRLEQMKNSCLLVNTSRGGLIDSIALAEALEDGVIGGAGLDVFETEPLPDEHPLRRSPNTLLTSHMAWYSLQSVPRLQQLSALETVGFMTGQPARNPVNRPVQL